eukprot:gene237-429_t
MVFIPVASSHDCPSCGRLTNLKNDKCGVCERTQNMCYEESYMASQSSPFNRCPGDVKSSRPRKLRKIENCDSGSSDDEISSISINSDDHRGKNYIFPKDEYSRSSSTSPDMGGCSPMGTPPKHNDGLSLLLEALMQSDSKFESDLTENVSKSAQKSRRKIRYEFNSERRSTSPSLSDTERWSMMYDALEEYGKIHGHCNAPNSHECVVRGGLTVKLGTWLSTQRQLKRKGNLRPERETPLQDLVDKGLLQWSMPSIASPDDEKWTVMFNALLKYGQKHNHFNVPYSHDCTLEDGSQVKLGAWLRKQREQKKKGNLRPDRDDRLQSLVEAGVLRMPSAHTTDDDQWNSMMDALEGYGAKHGHCNVPQSHEYKLEDNTVVRLGAWLRKQRELKKKGVLRNDREIILKALVDENMLLWDAPCHCPSDDEKWDIMLDSLIKYSETHGHCNLSSCHEFTVADGSSVKLGAWLSQQRHHKKKGKLRVDREAKLQILVDEGKLSWGMRYDGMFLRNVSSPLSSEECYQ